MVVTIYWIAYIRTLNGSNYTRPFFVLCIAMCFYIFGYIMELNSATVTQMEFWNKIEYIGIPFVSALWLNTALIYTGHFTRYRKTLFAIIYIIPIVSFFARLTNDYHHLYFSSVNFIEKSGNLIMIKEMGPLMHVQGIHSTFMIIVSMSLFVNDFMHNKEERKGKIVLIAAASTSALIGMILLQIQPSSYTFDYMALCLPLTSLFVIFAIAFYDFLESKAVGRRKVFECVSDAILLVNDKNKILDYNIEAKQLFQRININLNNGYTSQLFSQIPNLLKAIEKPEKSVVKLNIDSIDMYYEITTRSIDNTTSEHGWVKIIHDVTKIYQLNEELVEQATTDCLSTLYNRRAFFDIGTQWVLKAEAEATPIHLFMMDFDYFKNINDRYGHPVGDLTIRDFSFMLKEYFDTDALVARIGGEEFSVLQLGLSDDEMYKKLNGFLEKNNAHEYDYNDNKFHLSVSIGVTRKTDGQTFENMMLMADKALYKSKDKGRNCITML